MGKLKDLTGMRFGNLTVIKIVGRGSDRHILWLCKCDCGNETIIPSNALRTNKTKSCGCLQRKKSSKHHKSGQRLYKAYIMMKQRCINPQNKSYKWYGGRGIKICNEWLADFMNFYDWAMDNGYKEGLTLDRIDVNGNYEPNNCRWATYKQQNNNRRTTKYITLNNETHSLKEWAEINNINYHSFISRINRGMDIETALERKEYENRGFNTGV